MKSLRLFPAFLIACVTLAASRTTADDSGFSMPLVNGRDLDGWQVTGCDAAVEDGLLVLRAGDGFVHSDQEYDDFVLQLDWRARKKSGWDSGIYFRAELPAHGQPWPSRYQANLLEGKEGNTNGLNGAESQGLVRPGEWNHFQLTCVGDTAELEINGRPAWKVSGVEAPRGYIGLQSEVEHGGQFEFRNIRITELNYRSLFNGRDLAGWEGGDGDAAACWKVDQGDLVCTGEPGPWLRSRKRYDDFNLRLEYQLKPGGNSGVYARVPENGAHQGLQNNAAGGRQPTGVEVQILDDASDRYRDIQPYQFCGSVYAIAPAEHHVGRPAGRWNSLEIDCRGPNYRVVHNGVTVVEALAAKFPELNERLLCGFLGLQNHSEEVRFRRLRIATVEDHLCELQSRAISEGRAAWGHWGPRPNVYTGWTRHSNRLVPIYTFGLSLADVAGNKSPYRAADELEQLYGRLPDATLNPQAEYFDQTGVYRLQEAAAAAGKKNIVLVIFDGMDWQTTHAAAVYRSGRVGYHQGRGTGLVFQDYRGVAGDFGCFVSSPHNDGTACDVNRQVVLTPGGMIKGGYDPLLGGPTPWTPGADPTYLIGKSDQRKHAVTDSAASATSMTSGVKTYNDAINVDAEGRQVVPIARELQAQGFAIGVITSVPVSHATPAAAYANNVSRDDYQDLARDLVGLPSVAHRDKALAGVDVLLGAGWGHERAHDALQGDNYVPGNRYIAADDWRRVDAERGGKYEVVERTTGMSGTGVLAAAAVKAREQHRRLLGFFGVPNGHLPFQTADGRYNPTRGVGLKSEAYTQSDITENPTLADMTTAALAVLERTERGFWLMIEAGDVDWANHDDNLDNSIGAVLSGDAAFQALVTWIEDHQAWSDTAVIVTADHGHYLFLDQPEALAARECKEQGARSKE